MIQSVLHRSTRSTEVTPPPPYLQSTPPLPDMRATYWPLLALVVLGVLTTLTTALPYDMDDDDDADDDLLLPPPRARRVMDSDVISPRDAMTSEDVTSSRDARHADHRQRVRAVCNLVTFSVFSLYIVHTAAL